MAEVGKFTQPDHSGNPRCFIEFLEMVERIPEVRDFRAQSYRQMRLHPGATALDVGCGLGTATREMAGLVGPEGRAYGVDISDAMIAEARSHIREQTNIEFTSGNAASLPYADAMLDAVRMERVLLYVPERLQVIREMMRVTKPGGRVVICDTDIDCTAIYSKDPALTRKMTSLLVESFANPRSGRELPALMRASGLEEVTVELVAMASTYEFCVLATQGALRAAAEAGKVAPSEVEEWYRGLAELEAVGDFLQLWFFVIVGGTVPETR